MTIRRNDRNKVVDTDTPIQNDREQKRAGLPASIYSKGKQKLKQELLLNATRKGVQQSEEKEQDGKKELLQSAEIGGVLAQGVSKSRDFQEKEPIKMRIHRAKMKINHADGVSQSRMYRNAGTSSHTAGKARRWTAGEKFRKLRFVKVISGLFQKKQSEEQSAKIELGIKKAIQTFFLTGSIGVVTQVVLTALPILLIIVLLYNSPIALFMPKLDDGGNIREVLAGYYREFNEDLNIRKQESGTSITYVNGSTGMANFRDVLMVYMIKYYTGTGEIGTVVTDKAKENLKTVFDEMNYYRNETTTHTIKAGESLGQVVTSAYCSCVKCCGQWSGGPTASGVMPTANHTIAVDAKNPFLPMGTKVLFNGIVYTVEDTGNFDRFGVQFDVYFSDHTAAQNWGHKTFEAFLAEGESNEVVVTNTSLNVYNLTYEDYIETGRLTSEQEELLRELMTSDIWENFSDGTAGSLVAIEALTKVGCAYSQADRYGEGVYDCSSLVERLYRDVEGIELPNIASTQGKYCYDNGMTITEDMLQPGDLIFYSYEKNGQFMDISHVAIYVGDGMMVHASSPTRGVVYDPLNPSNIGLYGRPY